MIKTLFAVSLLAPLAFADDPVMLKRDGKEAAAIHRLLLHQQIDAAKIQAILARYAQTHNCPTGKAGLNQMAQLQCEVPPAPKPELKPEVKPKEEKQKEP